MKISRFLSCDWGTSSFRLRLVEAPALSVLGEENSSHGIADTFADWKLHGNNNHGGRLLFYLDVLRKNIIRLEQSTGESLSELPIVLCGMASSSVGMMEIEYKEVPFSADGSDLLVHKLDLTDFDNLVYVISGAKTDDDVLRGEETQLAGCFGEYQESKAEQLFIFPGTHSKHIVVENGMVTGFKTYMTGEFFELLAEKSILSVNIESAEFEGFASHFEHGVAGALDSNILNAAFKVRTNDLFSKLSKRENYHYLSGLVIGTELVNLLSTSQTRIVIVCNKRLQALYQCALNTSLFAKQFSSVTFVPEQEAIIKGQYNIYNRIK